MAAAAVGKWHLPHLLVLLDQVVQLAGDGRLPGLELVHVLGLNKWYSLSVVTS